MSPLHYVASSNLHPVPVTVTVTVIHVTVIVLVIITVTVTVIHLTKNHHVTTS